VALLFFLPFQPFSTMSVKVTYAGRCVFSDCFAHWNAKKTPAAYRLGFWILLLGTPGGVVAPERHRRHSMAELGIGSIEGRVQGDGGKSTRVLSHGYRPLVVFRAFAGRLANNCASSQAPRTRGNDQGRSTKVIVRRVTPLVGPWPRGCGLAAGPAAATTGIAAALGTVARAGSDPCVSVAGLRNGWLPGRPGERFDSKPFSPS